MAKRGRPSKRINTVEKNLKVNTVQMNALEFNEKLFIPMRTNTKIDEFFSGDKGLMPGVNYVCTGDPGSGKTTLLLDVLANLQKQGKKCLFVSGEMNAIDMVGYVRRYPKFGDLEILFMGDYADNNPDLVLRKAFSKGYDVILIDSMAEIADLYTEYFGGTNKSNQTKLLQLLQEHNLGGNDEKINTSFLVIQQVTKGGVFVGSNKLKHMTTGMLHLKITGEGRFLYFSKNRRGGNMNKLYYSLDTNHHVQYLHEEIMDMER